MRFFLDAYPAGSSLESLSWGTFLCQHEQQSELAVLFFPGVSEHNTAVSCFRLGCCDTVDRPASPPFIVWRSWKPVAFSAPLSGMLLNVQQLLPSPRGTCRLIVEKPRQKQGRVPIPWCGVYSLSFR